MLSAGYLHPVATVRGVALCLSYPPPPPIDFFYRISQLLCRFALCRFHLSFGLVLTDMEPDAEIEALAAARNVAVHWGSPDNLVEHLVELAAERKVYVRPTSAGIAAEAELVLPGSTRAVRTTEPLAAPAHQVHIHVEHLHIHVEHLHIHVAGPEGLTDLQEAPH